MEAGEMDASASVRAWIGWVEEERPSTLDELSGRAGESGDETMAVDKGAVAAAAAAAAVAAEASAKAAAAEA